MSEDILERLPGTYQVLGVTSEVRAENGRLFINHPLRGRFEVFAKSAVELFAPTLGMLDLIESDGKIIAMKTREGFQFKRVQ